MDDLLPTATSAEAEGMRIAVLPVGSFEQHGPAHALITDTVIACAVAQEISFAYSLFLLPPITFSCSHEHAAFSGTVSIRASTLTAVIEDIQASLKRSGIDQLVLVNGHGGNYVLGNIVQEANSIAPLSMLLFPLPRDWESARRHGGMSTTAHEDMHAGELETSILLHVRPDLVRSGYTDMDWRADERPLLLVSGMSAYTRSGVVGFPSLGSAEKGERALASLTESFKPYLEALDAGGYGC